jgi:hypothetical protein
MRFFRDSPDAKGSPKAFAGGKHSKASKKEEIKKALSKRLISILQIENQHCLKIKVNTNNSSRYYVS